MLATSERDTCKGGATPTGGHAREIRRQHRPPSWAGRCPRSAEAGLGCRDSWKARWEWHRHELGIQPNLGRHEEVSLWNPKKDLQWCFRTSEALSDTRRRNTARSGRHRVKRAADRPEPSRGVRGLRRPVQEEARGPGRDGPALRAVRAGDHKSGWFIPPDHRRGRGVLRDTPHSRRRIQWWSLPNPRC